MFQTLLQQLSAEHERELSLARTEILYLRMRLGEDGYLDSFTKNNDFSGISTSLGDSSYVGSSRAKLFMASAGSRTGTMVEPVVGSQGAHGTVTAVSVERGREPRASALGDTPSTVPATPTGSIGTFRHESTITSAHVSSCAMRRLSPPRGGPICSCVAVPVRTISPPKGQSSVAPGSRWALLSSTHSTSSPVTAAVRLSSRPASPLAAMRACSDARARLQEQSTNSSENPTGSPRVSESTSSEQRLVFSPQLSHRKVADFRLTSPLQLKTPVRSVSNGSRPLSSPGAQISPLQSSAAMRARVGVATPCQGAVGSVHIAAAGGGGSTPDMMKSV